jgi:hypothetical protein
MYRSGPGSGGEYAAHGRAQHLDAVRYARAALIPGHLLDRPGLDVERVAQAFGIHARELAAARDERRPETAV